MIGTSPGGQEQQEEIVNERSDDITKSVCDLYSYRFVTTLYEKGEKNPVIFLRKTI